MVPWGGGEGSAFVVRHAHGAARVDDQDALLSGYFGRVHFRTCLGISEVKREPFKWREAYPLIIYLGVTVMYPYGIRDPYIAGQE